jgi:hypothetical protein
MSRYVALVNNLFIRCSHLPLTIKGCHAHVHMDLFPIPTRRVQLAHLTALIIETGYVPADVDPNTTTSHRAICAKGGHEDASHRFENRVKKSADETSKGVKGAPRNADDPNQPFNSAISDACGYRLFAKDDEDARPKDKIKLRKATPKLASHENRVPGDRTQRRMVSFFFIPMGRTQTRIPEPTTFYAMP